MGTRSEIFFASENRGVRECDFGLGLRMNQHNKDSSSSSLPRRKAVTAMPPDKTGGYGYGGAGGPCFWNPSNQVSRRNDIYDVVGDSVSMAVQYPSPDSLPFNLSAGTMAGAPERSGVAFTVTQWQELQRQSAIYKYMVASVPVPPELLIPFTKPIPGSPSPASNKGRGSGELGLGINKDMEPWRCRRTDGKKWRCTRDVAPEQKYCERHTHKGRHARSRKPVELPSDFITKSTTVKPYQKPCSVSGINQSRREREREREDQLCSFPSPAVAASDDQYRCLDWFIKGETVPVSNTNQEWLNMMMQPIPKRDDDPLSLRSYSGLGLGDQTQQTRVFWSEAERGEIGRHKSSVSSNVKLPFSCLTLSVSGGGDEANEIPQMGLSGGESMVGELKPNWMMMSPVSWVNSPPGGPLGEALCLGIASSSSSTSKSSYGDPAQGLNFMN